MTDDRDTRPLCCQTFKAYGETCSRLNWRGCRLRGELKGEVLAYSKRFFESGKGGF